MADSSDAALPPPLAVTYCAVGTLRPDPRNARKHPKQQVDQIVASIRQFGFVNPILADPTDALLPAMGASWLRRPWGLPKSQPFTYRG
jgi:ParB-like nuclease family protein